MAKTLAPIIFLGSNFILSKPRQIFQKITFHWRVEIFYIYDIIIC